MSKKAKKETDELGYIRVTLCIPRELWGYFERQRKSPKHNGNRSSYVRSLILEEKEALTR